MAWKGSSKGNSKGKGPAPTFLQTAIEGAVVSALGLAEWSEGNAKGGNGGGKAKGKTDEAAAKKAEETERVARTCTWDDCRAARNKARTWGTGACCFQCRRALGARPPVERMIDWAFDALVAANPPL